MDEKTLIKRIGYWFERVQPSLSHEDRREAKHFYDHDEWEMAFEIIGLHVISDGNQYTDSDRKELMVLASACKLDVDGGVSDYHLYQKLKDWAKLSGSLGSSSSQDSA